MNKKWRCESTPNDVIIQPKSVCSQTAMVTPRYTLHCRLHLYKLFSAVNGDDIDVFDDYGIMDDNEPTAAVQL